MMLFIGVVLVLAALTGCGGGGSKVPNPGPGGPSQSAVSGTVTDINGAPIVNATVQIGTLSTTSTQGGTYIIPGVTVPAGQASIVVPVTATSTIAGHAWSGSNIVEVLNGETVTSNTHVVMSDTANQATLAGTVRDAVGNTLAGARVFISAGPNTSSSGTVGFSNLGSLQAYTDTHGHYSIPNVPVAYAAAPVSYTIAGSFVGYSNKTANNVTFTAGVTKQLDLSLDPTSTSPKLPAVTNFDALSFTGPAVATRSAGAQRAYEAIKQYLLARYGLQGHHTTDPSRITRHNSSGRSTPAGSLIETDLFWDYVQLNNLFGYEIDRATGTQSYFDIATLRDPLGDYFADLDGNLTPDTAYTYTVRRLDTINFPKNPSDTSSVSDPASPVQVTPLGPLNIVAPVGGATVSATPTLTWAAVNRADSYTVLVYNRFPDYQSDTQGVKPILSQTVNAPAIAYTLTTALPSGTYYWAVAADKGTSSTAIGRAISISPIGSFVVP